MAKRNLSERATSICERIRQLRVQNNYTQEQIAKHLGLKVNTYAAYERLEAEPSVDTIYALCLFYNEDMDEWLGLTKQIKHPVILAPNADSTAMVPLQNDDLSDAIAQFSLLPPESAGELKVIFEYLDYKYNKRNNG